MFLPCMTNSASHPLTVRSKNVQLRRNKSRIKPQSCTVQIPTFNFINEPSLNVFNCQPISYLSDTHQLCLPTRITGNVGHCHPDPAWTRPGWGFSNSSLTEKVNAIRPRQRSREEEFQGHWVICLPCVFVWLWEYGGGTTSDPRGVKGSRARERAASRSYI